MKLKNKSTINVNNKRTKKSLIVKFLRRLFLYSVERRLAYKIYGKKCYICGSTDRLHCHHVRPVNWEKLLKTIYEELLCDVKMLKIVCKKCHEKIHIDKDKDKK